jgi:hypothetical protein
MGLEFSVLQMEHVHEAFDDGTRFDVFEVVAECVEISFSIKRVIFG